MNWIDSNTSNPNISDGCTITSNTNIPDGWTKTITITDGIVDEELITVIDGYGNTIPYIKPVTFPNWVVTRKDLVKVKKVIFNPPATIVIWADGHKEVVKCSDSEFFDPEVGVAMCFMKRIFDSRNQFTKLVDNSWHDYCKGYLKTVRYDTKHIKNPKAEVRKNNND